MANSLALGRVVDIPTLILTPGPAVNNGFGKVGFNTKNPSERFEVNLKNGDKAAIRASIGGSASFDLQGALNDGKTASIFRIDYTNPNPSQAYGQTDFYQNDLEWLSLTETGDPTFHRVVNSLYGYQVASTRVIGGQVAAIANSTGSTADNTRALNEILAAMRSHGLIAT